MLTPQEVLGVSPGASVEEAEFAYHALLRQEHPDLHQGAGPERIARAEQRTRELNAAIWLIRTGAAARVDVGAPAGSTRTAPPPGSTGGPSGRVWDDDGWDPDGTWDEAAGAWQPPSQPRPPLMASCPWCGREFLRAVDLKDHVFDDHDLRVDRRERASLFGGRLGRATRAAGHLPLWAVIPVNALAATVVGLLVSAGVDEVLGWWSAAIVMSPTAVVLIDRLSEIEL